MKTSFGNQKTAPGTSASTNAWLAVHILTKTMIPSGMTNLTTIISNLRLVATPPKKQLMMHGRAAIPDHMMWWHGLHNTVSTSTHLKILQPSSANSNQPTTDQTASSATRDRRAVAS